MDKNMEDYGSKALAEYISLKKHGNHLYRSEDYEGAIAAYTMGIQILEIYMSKNEGNIQIRNWDKGLALFHGNRSECWFKLSERRLCLEDAKTSVNYHPEWYKGHFRVARAFRDLGKFRKSVYAFVQAYMRLPSSEVEDLKKKVLYELIETAFVIESQLDSLLIELRKTPVILRAHLINFYLENKAWNIVEFIVTKVWKLTDSDLWRPRSSSSAQWDVDLVHFCDKDLLSQNWWVCKVLHHFLVLKPDHHQLKFHPGDTYFHATISIVVQTNTQRQETLELVSVDNVHDNADVDHNADATELLHYVVENIVIPKGDLNIQDDKGNTVLHHLANFEESKLKIDYCCNGPAINDVILYFRIYEMRVMESLYPAPRTYPISVLSYILSKDVDCFMINNDGKTALDLTSQSDKRTLLHGKASEERNKLKAKNIKVLSSLMSYHKIPVIPKELLKISADSCKDLLTSLADAGKWLVLKELVIQFKQAKGETTLPTFAKEMSLTRVVEAPAEEMSESDKIDVVRLLVNHEASVDSPGPIEASIRNEEWKLTMELLDLGVNPDGVTLSPGDTPYHAALYLALNKLDGDFSMLEKLKEIHDQKKSLKKDVTATDKDGNTLLHMAAQATSHQHSLKALELLSKWQIPTNIKNKDNKMAGDYLPDWEDDRHQYVQVPTSKNKSKSKKGTEEAASKIDTKSKSSVEENIETTISTLLSKIPEAAGFLNLTQPESKFVVQRLLDSDDDNIEEGNSPNKLGKSEFNGITREELTQNDIDKLSRIEQMEIDPKDFDSLEWDIECTESVWRTLISKRQATVDIGSRKLFLRNLVSMKLKQLGSGDWKNLKQMPRKDVPRSLKLYREPLTSGAFILWERAIAFSPRLSDTQETSGSYDSQESAIREGRVYAEHVRLWEIGLKKSDLRSAVSKVVKSHQRGKECVVKKFLMRQKTETSHQSEKTLPILFTECTDQQELDEVQRGQVIQLTPPASLHENEFTILKLYTLSSQMVEAILNDGESKVDFPFRVTEIEHIFINLKPEAPLLLLGHSGTGKTTCCLYRLFNEFLNYWELAKDLGRPHIECFNITGDAKKYGQESDRNESQNSEDTDGESDNKCKHLHQIFVTKNSVLCQELENSFVKLCQTPKWLCDHMAQRAEDIPNRMQNMEDNSFPLFLTSRHLLLILDASVNGQAFFPRDKDLGMKLYIPGWEPQEDIFNIGQQLHRRNPRGFQNARLQRQADPRRESTYEVFAHEIWPKIKKGSTFHPSLVWTEIVSFIKGSYEALECPKGYLNKEQYISIGKKRAPNFDGDRPLIYEIFQRYQKYLKDNNLFDEADVVFHIYKRRKETPGIIYWMPHTIYIDETQDFSQAELALLVSLCRFPNQMFLTGDTAQSIMRGISFRFADLKSIFFHRTHQTLVGQTQVKKPDKIRQLRHNYRSHTRILALASAILELFPETNDKLEKDQGMFEGPKPVIIETCKPEELVLLVKGNTWDTTAFEFGAHQAILVVDDDAKNKLPLKLRDGIVLTINESKGLEFDDILIYNFFKDSQASKEWRVVTSFLNELVKTVNKSKSRESSSESLVVLNQDALQQPGRPRALMFEKHLHKLLDTDLKQLYTAVTRARVNIWIFDEDTEKRAPMFEYFKALNLVKILGGEDKDGDNGGKGFMETSTPEQWKQAGDKHMNQKRYELAATCYKKANRTHLEKLATAFITSEEAAKEANTSVKKRKLYLKAGAQFLYCKAMEQAVRCFQHAQANKFAALTLEKLGRFEEASKQYKKVPDLESATHCLEQVGHYRRAIHLRVDNKQFSEAVDCLHRYQNLVKTFERKGQVVPDILVENKLREDYCNYLWLRLAELQHSQGKMKDFHKTVAKVTDKQETFSLLKRLKFWKEAAELLHDEGAEGQRKEAVHLMMRSGQLDTALVYAEEGFFKPLRAAIHISMAMECNNDLKVKENFTAAQKIYGELEDRCGQALATLLLGQSTKDLKQLREAYKLFDDPDSPHLPGRLESFAAIAELSSSNSMLLVLHDCSDFIKNIIGLGQKFIQILTGGKNQQWREYVEFYGLELDVTRQKLTMTWYPHQHPLYEKIQKSDVDAKYYTVDVMEAVKVLTIYTLESIKKLTKVVRRSLQQLIEQRAQKITCKIFHEELKCDQTSCKNQHNYHSNKDTDRAAVLNLLILNVELDYNLFQAADTLESCGMAGMKTILLAESNWKTVDRLLEFLVPSRPYPDPDIGQVLKFIAYIGNSKETLAQIERYFRFWWVDVNTHMEARELVRSTCWVTKAVVWSSLLQLKMDVQKEVTMLETQINQKLTNKSSENLSSLGLYLSEAERGGQKQIRFAGSLFMQSFKEISCSGDMRKSTNLFIEMMNLIGQCGQGMRLPSSDLEYIIFWMEFHFCVSIFTLANIHRKKAFYLPNSLLARVNQVNICKKDTDKTVQQAVLKQQLYYVTMETQNKLTNILLGTEKSSFSLIHYFKSLCKGNSAEKLLAERILILTLVTLLNIPSNYVHEKFEVCIRKELFKIDFKAVPQRLQNLIHEAKKSKSYIDIVRSLQLFFSIQKHDDLRYCMWHGQVKNTLELLDLSKFPDKPFSDQDIAQMVKDETQLKDPKQAAASQQFAAPQQLAAPQQQPMEQKPMQQKNNQQQVMQQQPMQQQPMQQQPMQQKPMQPMQQQPMQQQPIEQQQQPTQTLYSQPRESRDNCSINLQTNYNPIIYPSNWSTTLTPLDISLKMVNHNTTPLSFPLTGQPNYNAIINPRTGQPHYKPIFYPSNWSTTLKPLDLYLKVVNHTTTPPSIPSTGQPHYNPIIDPQTGQPHFNPIIDPQTGQPHYNPIIDRQTGEPQYNTIKLASPDDSD